MAGLRYSEQTSFCMSGIAPNAQAMLSQLQPLQTVCSHNNFAIYQFDIGYYELQIASGLNVYFCMLMLTFKARGLNYSCFPDHFHLSELSVQGY